jgi:hypothetical protein
VTAFLNIFSPWWKNPGGNFPHVRRSLRPGSEERSSRGYVKKKSSMTDYIPQPSMRLTSPQQVPCSFRFLRVQGNLDKTLRTLAMQISQFPSADVQIDHH